MRKLSRRGLALTDRRELRRRQSLCDSAASAREEWKRFRPSAAAGPVLDALRLTAGTTERCFYCSDSRGADIDHYVPISTSYTTTFAWTNLQLVCSMCNRQKLARNPYDAHGHRVLIDPTEQDPWDHFTFIADSGLIAPRYVDPDAWDALATGSLDILPVLNHEAIVERRRRAYRRMAGAAERVLRHGDTPQTRRDLLEAFEDESFGLGRWCTAREGATQYPFADLRQQHRPLWRRLCRASIAE